MRFSGTVYVVRAATTPSPDGGDPILDWTAATVTAYSGQAPQPLTSQELVVLQQRMETTHRTWLEPGADLTAADRIRYGGAAPGPGVTDYEIDGEPEHWPDLRGRPDHIEVRLFRVSGG